MGMIYLKKVVGIYYRGQQMDVTVLGRGLTEREHLGTLHLTGIDEKDPMILKSELEQFFSELDSEPEVVFVALSPDQLTFHHFRFPAEVEDNLDDALRLQLLSLVSSDEEYSFDKIIRKSADKSYLDVDVYLFPRKEIRKLIDFFQSLNLDPDALTILPLAFEKAAEQKKEIRNHPFFILDLDSHSCAAYLFEAGRFTAFRRENLNPETTDITELLNVVETCAANQRLEEDAELELFANVSDDRWYDNLDLEESTLLQPIRDFSPFDEGPVRNLRSLAVALYSFTNRKKVCNIIPPEWRKKSSVVNFVPTIILGALVLILLLGNLFRGYIQEAAYIQFLEENVELHRPQHQEVMQVRRNIEKIRREIQAYDIVLNKPISDLQILQELTEKSSEKTYLQQYVRDTTLDISGYTDSYQDLAQRLESISTFRSITQRGSITKKGDLENFHLIIQLEENSEAQ